MTRNLLDSLSGENRREALRRYHAQVKQSTCTLNELLDHATGVKPMVKPRKHLLPAMPGHTHKSLVAACLFVLESRGVFAWKSNVGAAKMGERFVRFGVKGQPDIIGIMPRGQFLGIECKVGRDTLRPEQTQFLDCIEAQGGLVLVVHDTIDPLVAFLNTVMR